MPAYVVFTDATLTAIAETMPGSLPALAQISGVGARKLDAHGGAVLEVLAGADPEAVAERALRQRMRRPERRLTENSRGSFEKEVGARRGGGLTSSYVHARVQATCGATRAEREEGWP